MDKEVAWVDGWEIRQRCDGSFGVYDDHGLLDGPFGTKPEAMAAALRLPHPKGNKLKALSPPPPVTG